MSYSSFFSAQETRPFTKFVEMELERDYLYRSFTELDEPQEISNKWIVFAESCSRNLSAINNLASMAFSRLDEAYENIDREEDYENSPLPIHTLLYGPISNQMLSLSQFQLKLGVLIYVYSQVRNRGVFSHPPKDSQYLYYINAKETLDDVLYRILSGMLPSQKEAGHSPIPTIGDMLNILMPLLKLEQRKRLIPIFNKLPEDKKDKFVLAKIGDYDRMQGITLISNILELVHYSAQDFWWDDPISTLSILDHAESHFKAAIDLWKEQKGELAAQASKLLVTFVPLCRGYQSLSLSQHYYLLAESALETGDISYSSRYYTEALNKINEAKKIIIDHGLFVIDKTILDEIEKEEAKTKNIATLSTLAVLYENAINQLTKGNKEEALNLSNKINELIEKLEETSPVPYIYGISVSYASAASVFSEIIEKDSSDLGVIDRLISQFSFPLRSMSDAINHINIAKIKLDDEEPEKSYSNLIKLEEEYNNLRSAIGLLPAFLVEKEEYKAKIEAIVYYLRSFISENKIYIYADNNIVLDLILRARAHYYAKKAEEKTNSLSKDEDFKTLIKKRVLETKSAGILTETNLVSLGLQSAYSKKVRDVIEQILVLYSQMEKPPEFIIESVIKQFEDMVEFRELLGLIELDNNELIALKQDAIIKGNEINWDYILRRKNFIPSIQKMFEAIKLILLGELAADLKKKSDAVKYYTKAKKLLYEVSEILGKVVEYIDGNKELPSLIYTLALFTQENLNSIRDNRKRKEVPYKQIVGILDYLVLNI